MTTIYHQAPQPLLPWPLALKPTQRLYSVWLCLDLPGLHRSPVLQWELTTTTVAR